MDEYKQGETKYISGTYVGEEPHYIRLIVNENREPVSPFTSLKNNAFRYYKPGLKPTDKVTVIFYGQDYKELGQQEITITPGEPTKLVSLYPFVEGKDMFIRGK
ncbi:immunoglobulin-like domain-containing protein [Enterococcus faecalis]|uniref:immunoglobulin-like domain-containing protein n=1 Tax=Enterococcus faecalis TaxID=1351 RepID=UPI003B63A761